jgi:hypothetical protein
MFLRDATELKEKAVLNRNRSYNFKYGAHVINWYMSIYTFHLKIYHFSHDMSCHKESFLLDCQGLRNPDYCLSTAQAPTWWEADREEVICHRRGGGAELTW